MAERVYALQKPNHIATNRHINQYQIGKAFNAFKKSKGKECPTIVQTEHIGFSFTENELKQALKHYVLNNPGKMVYIRSQQHACGFFLHPKIDNEPYYLEMYNPDLEFGPEYFPIDSKLDMSIDKNQDKIAEHMLEKIKAYFYPYGNLDSKCYSLAIHVFDQLNKKESPAKKKKRKSKADEAAMRFIKSWEPIPSDDEFCSNKLEIKRCDFANVSALTMAVISEQLKAVEHCIKAKHDLNQPCSYREDTPLFNAVQAQNLEIIRALLKAGADVDQANYEGATPLIFAAQEGNLEVVRLLVSAGANVNAKSKNHTTPLFAAARHANTEIVEFLTSCPGIQVNAPSFMNLTPMEAACLYEKTQGKTEIFEALLEAGCKLNFENGFYGRALDIAFCNIDDKANNAAIKTIVQFANENNMDLMGLCKEEKTKAVLKKYLENQTKLSSSSSMVKKNNKQGLGGL